MGYVFSSTILILFGKILFNLSLLSMSNGCQLNHIVAAKTDYLKLHVAQEWLPFVPHTIQSASLLKVGAPGSRQIKNHLRDRHA